MTPSMKRAVVGHDPQSAVFFLQIPKSVICSSLFAIKSFCSSSSSSYSCRSLWETPPLQTLLKIGFIPTLKSLNHFLIFLSRNHRFESVLHFFSQMNSNGINRNSRTQCIVARALLYEKRLEEAENFVAQMEKHGVFPKKWLLDSLIRGLCTDARDPEKAFYLLQDCLRNRGISPSSLTFSLLIHSFSSQGKMDRAIEVMESMTNGNVRYVVNNFICSSVVSGFCKIGKPELALRFYENAGKIGAFRPNVVTYTALVSALCKEGKIQEVSYLLCRMEKEGVVLDAIFYSSWISGYLSEGILMEAFRKHKLMVENGIKPDTVSYTILIDGFSKEGDVEKAVGFLNEMEKDGLKPNLVTYTAVMWGLCKRGKLEEAFNVFRKVEDLGFKVDEITYSTLIDGLCRIGDFDQVFCLLEEMENKGIKTGIVTYNTLINGLCKAGRTLEADEISKSIFADNVTYSTLLHGYIEENNLAGILETKRRLEEAEVCMDIVMCNVLIKALFMTGAMEEAYMIFKGLPDMGLQPDSVTFCVMIDGCCKVGRLSEALEIFDAYRTTSLASGVVCYYCILCGLCQNGMVDMAIKVFFELIEKALVPDRGIYMMLIRSTFKERNATGVLKFLNGIEFLNTGIHNMVCADAIHFLCKRGYFESALDVYMVLRRKGSSITDKCYNVILKELFAKGDTLFTPGILNSYIKEYGLSKLSIYEILICYLCKKDVSKALRFLEKIEEKHIYISIPITMIETLIKKGKILDAYNIIAEARGSQIVFDVFTYNKVVDRLCKGGFLRRALDLCLIMKKKGITPTIVTYNSVLNGLCQQGCLVEAFRLFNSLEEINVVPTDITYSTLIVALCKEGFLLDAKKLFERMILNGFTPNSRVYNSLIDGYCKFGSMDESLKLLLDLERSIIKPDAFTISALINGYCRNGDMEGALGFFYEYKRKGISPDFLGFIYLMKGLCTKGRMEEARSILREMLQTQSVMELINRMGSEIKAESIAHVLVLLCEQGRIQEAITVLNEVGNSVTSKPLTSSHATDLDVGLYMVGKIDGLVESHENFIEESLCYDFHDQYSIIASLYSKGEIQKANKIAKEMLSNLEKSC